MKREIKFRAWDTYNERMVDNPYVFERMPDYENKPELYRFYEDWFDLEDGISRACYLMQFTGLKDKKGVDIYEGDILQLDDILVPVTFDDGGFQIVTNIQHGKSPLVAERTKRFEVIGNIYANPDLLTPLTNLK